MSELTKDDFLFVGIEHYHHPPHLIISFSKKPSLEKFERFFNEFRKDYPILFIGELDEVVCKSSSELYKLENRQYWRNLESGMDNPNYRFYLYKNDLKDCSTLLNVLGFPHYIDKEGFEKPKKG